MKTKFYKAWANYAHKRSQERNFEEYKRQKIIDKVKMERAVYHFKIETERKYFEIMKKWHLSAKVEKQIQREHEEKLQAFMENMQRKADEKKRQEEMALEIEKKRQFERVQEGRDDLATVPEMQPVNIDINQDFKFDNYDLSKKIPDVPEVKEESKYDYSPEIIQERSS